MSNNHKTLHAKSKAPAHTAPHRAKKHPEATTTSGRQGAHEEALPDTSGPDREDTEPETAGGRVPHSGTERARPVEDLDDAETDRESSLADNHDTA